MAENVSSVVCTYCQEEINDLRVKCCSCLDFEVCLQCFACGAEIGPHRNDHPYTFVAHGVANIFGRSNWTDAEELELLDAVELYTFGNWEPVSAHMKTRTPEEVEEEYVGRYVEGNIGKATWLEVVNRRPIVDEIEEEKDNVCKTLSSMDVKEAPSIEEARNLGYMILRDDYHVEYDPSAEQLVSCLQLNTLTDSNTEIALKLAHVDMYIRKVRERARRKRIVRDYGLISKFFDGQLEESNEIQTEIDFESRMKIFCQFLREEEYRNIIEGVIKERQLRSRLGDLLKFRNLGMTGPE